MSRTTKHEPTEEGIKIIPGELDDGWESPECYDKEDYVVKTPQSIKSPAFVKTPQSESHQSSAQEYRSNRSHCDEKTVDPHLLKESPKQSEKSEQSECSRNSRYSEQSESPEKIEHEEEFDKLEQPGSLECLERLESSNRSYHSKHSESPESNAELSQDAESPHHSPSLHSHVEEQKESHNSPSCESVKSRITNESPAFAQQESPANGQSQQYSRRSVDESEGEGASNQSLSINESQNVSQMLVEESIEEIRGRSDLYDPSIWMNNVVDELTELLLAGETFYAIDQFCKGNAGK